MSRRVDRRRPQRHALRSLAAVLLFVAACASPAGGSPGSPAPSLGPDVYVRAWLTQAVAPRFTFANLPLVTIAGGLFLDGQVAIPAIYPGPLLILPIERTITTRGVAAIVREADSQGLLGSVADFTAGGMMPGGPTAHLELIANGVRHVLTGDPTRLVRCGSGLRCVPDPGTPEAFASFWQRLSNLESWIGPELGGSATYQPQRVAILVVAPEVPEPPIAAGRQDWPLAAPFGTFGHPFAGLAGGRCGLVVEPEADLVLSAAKQANQLTHFIDRSGAARSLVIRVLVPGEPDPCLTAVAAG